MRVVQSKSGPEYPSKVRRGNTVGVINGREATIEGNGQGLKGERSEVWIPPRRCSRGSFSEWEDWVGEKHRKKIR